jgi:hypothetical protein
VFQSKNLQECALVDSMVGQKFKLQHNDSNGMIQ